jgi:hypothetical protein
MKCYISDNLIKRVAEEVSPTLKQRKKLLDDECSGFRENIMEWVGK